MLIIVFVCCMYATTDLKATNNTTPAPRPTLTMVLRSRTRQDSFMSNKRNNTTPAPRPTLTMVLRSRTRQDSFMSNKRTLRRPTLPEIPDELVLEILVRLPVKSLLRFKSVCWMWKAIISGPCFVRMHLQRSVHNHQRQLSFLLTPHLVDSISDDFWPTTFSKNFCFYKWQKGQASASLVYTPDFKDDFPSVYKFGHCNGLVLVPTNKWMYVLNPSTRELLTLPESLRSKYVPTCLCHKVVGLGLDPSTNRYKVVRCTKHRSDGFYPTMGMEIMTIEDRISCSSWRDTATGPPYPIIANQTATDPPFPITSGHTAIYFKGSLFWTLSNLPHIQSPESRLLRFCLQDEIFSFTVHPPCPALDHDNFILNELGGELCLAQFDSSLRMVIWMTHDGVNPQWDRRYILNVTPSLTIGISHHGSLLMEGHRIFQYDFQSHNTEDVACLDALRYQGPGRRIIDYACQNLFFVDVIPCIESLVSLACPV